MKNIYGKYTHQSKVGKSIKIVITKDGKLCIDNKYIQGASIILWDMLKEVLSNHDLTTSFDSEDKSNPGIARRKQEAIDAKDGTNKWVLANN